MRVIRGGRITDDWRFLPPLRGQWWVTAFLAAALLWLAIAALFSWRLAGKSLDDLFITNRLSVVGTVSLEASF